MNFHRKRVLVVGIAKSGLAATKLLVGMGAVVFITDEKEKRELKNSLKQIPSGVQVECGGSNFFSRAYDLIVTSPGVPFNHPGLVKARKRGVPVWPELELAWRCINPKKTIAITGTNGKTTTTALVGELLKKAGKKVVVGGNIGTPLSALVNKITPQTFLVLEVSSYQLEGHSTFHPNVGVFLNLTPDHLQRHGSMKKYAEVKGRLFSQFQSHDTAVLNKKDFWCRKIGLKIKGKKVWFPSPGLLRIAKHIRLPGEHNVENAMAAVAAVQAVGLKTPEITRGLETFKGVPHRIQVIRNLHGVTYVNDSKSTNVDSTLVALKSFDQPTILILGGRDKGAPYTPLIPFIRKTVKTILTIGEAASKIKKDLGKSTTLIACHALQTALSTAQKIAASGDVVLLSPACASFDQYQNFEHRGEHFAKLVKRLT